MLSRRQTSRVARPGCPAVLPGRATRLSFSHPVYPARPHGRQGDPATGCKGYCEKVSKFKMKTTYSTRPGCTGVATHEPTRPAGQRKSIALQWIFTEILRRTGPVGVPRQTSRTARPGCPGVTNDNRIARPGSTTGQPGSSVAGFISALIISKIESTTAAQCWSAFLVTF